MMLRNEENIVASVSKDDNVISANVSRDDASIQCVVGIGKGDKGDKGDSGYTPQKGVDYFTEEDISSLDLDKRVNDALEKELDVLLEELNAKMHEFGLDVEILKTSDEDIKKSINEVLNKIEYLARYSKGEVHPVNIY